MMTDGRNSFLAFVLALIVCATIANLTIWIFPPPWSVPAAKLHQQPPNGHAADEGNGPSPWWGIGETFFTGIIAVYAIRQFGEGRRSGDRQLRAYVVGVPKFMYAFDANSLPKFRFDYLNVGQTPAMKVRHKAGIELMQNPYQPGAALPELSVAYSAPMVLFPRTEFFGSMERAKPFTEDEIAAIVNDKIRIHLYGEIDYFSFGRHRITRFCSAVVADKGTLEKLTTSYKPADLQLNFQVAPMGNEAT